MGKNSGYIWSAYGIAFVVFLIIGFVTRARRERTKRALGDVSQTGQKR